MSPASNGWGALVGLAIGIGILLIAAGLLSRRHPSLSDQIAPYVAGPSARRSQDLEVPTLLRIFAPTLRAAAQQLQSRLGGGEALRARLVAAGREEVSIDRFRLEQVVAGALAIAAAAGVIILLVGVGRQVKVPAAVVLIAVAGVGGVVLVDELLSRQIRMRRQQVSMAFPAIADMLALAVAAGEPVAAAVERVARSSNGPLSVEMRRVGDLVRTGVPFTTALVSMADRLAVPELRRFADGVVVAVDRGTPVADVLRAQASDARAEAHRSLLETAGRKELLMLVPVVFLVLPTVVLVALFPGLAGLTLTVG